MVDPKENPNRSGDSSDDDELHRLFAGMLRHMNAAGKAAARVRPPPIEPDPSEAASSGLNMEQFRRDLEQISRREDLIREAWDGIKTRLAPTSSETQIAPSARLIVAAQAGAAAFRLLSGFKVRLEDLIKGWSQQPHELGIASPSLAGARSQSKPVPSIEDASTVQSHPPSAIVAAEWLPESGCLMLDWAKSAKTGPLKASATVEAFLLRAGQPSRLPASFRRFPDGSVSIDIVTIELPQRESTVLAGAEVEVAWLSDEEGMAQRLVVVFHLTQQ